MQYATNFSVHFCKTWIISTTRRTIHQAVLTPDVIQYIPGFAWCRATKPFYGCLPLLLVFFFVQQNLISENIPYTLALFLFIYTYFIYCLSLFFAIAVVCSLVCCSPFHNPFLLQSIIQTFYHRLFSLKFSTKLRRFYTLTQQPLRSPLLLLFHQTKFKGFFLQNCALRN